MHLLKAGNLARNLRTLLIGRIIFLTCKKNIVYDSDWSYSILFLTCEKHGFSVWVTHLCMKVYDIAFGEYISDGMYVINTNTLVTFLNI